MTVLSTLLSLVLGLPLGVLLVAGRERRAAAAPCWLLQVLNVIINLLRSVPFLIPDDHGVPPVPAHHWHGGGYHSHHRSAGGGGIPICGPSGGEQSP